MPLNYNMATLTYRAEQHGKDDMRAQVQAIMQFCARYTARLQTAFINDQQT